jgi:spore coat protein SA
MSNITYHLLTESEPFSEFAGGAISRWAGNVLRNGVGSVVVCPEADDSWRFSPECVFVLPGFKFYKTARRYLSRLPWLSHGRLIFCLFRPLLERLRRGDIVWIHNRPEFALALTPSIRRRGARVVLHLHNSHLSGGPEWLMKQIRVDKLVFVSEFLRQQAREKLPELSAWFAGSSVLYNGADQSIFYPPLAGRSNRQQVSVLFAGRLVEDKGVHILLEAMKLLEQQRVGLQAYIVGSSSFGRGEETDYIRRLKAAPPSTVVFLEYRSGPALGDLFREADMFCSPAVWDEPFGLVNVEALASGLPVVSTLSGGSKEVFAGGGGILVERGCAVQLAAALRRLAESPELRAQLGQQGYQSFLDRFTWSATRRQVQDIEKAIST